jgi:glutaredoxin
VQRAYNEKKVKIDAITNEEEREKKSKLLKEGKASSTQPTIRCSTTRRGKSTNDTAEISSDPSRK